jgi:hypothetical protein
MDWPVWFPWCLDKESFSMRKLLGVVAAALVLPAALIAADKVESGLKEGASVPAFNVRDVTGPAKGETLCYRCRYGARPTVTVFTRDVNDSVKSLVKKIDGKVGENKDKKMAAFVVVLTSDPDKVEPKLTEIASKDQIKNTPLTVIEGDAGPEGYKIAKDAEVTVMMWVEGKVKATHAFGKGQFDAKAVDAVIADTAKILN